MTALIIGSTTFFAVDSLDKVDFVFNRFHDHDHPYCCCRLMFCQFCSEASGKEKEKN